MPSTHNIALLGATGPVGGHFLTYALEAGHSVTALVRNPRKLAKVNGPDIFQGDATSEADVQAVIAGAEVVVSCIGNPVGVMIMERAASAIPDAAGDSDSPPKCILVTSIGCGGSSWLV